MSFCAFARWVLWGWLAFRSSWVAAWFVHSGVVGWFFFRVVVCVGGVLRAAVGEGWGVRSVSSA